MIVKIDDNSGIGQLILFKARALNDVIIMSPLESNESFAQL